MWRCPKLLCFFQSSCSFVWRSPEVSADLSVCCFGRKGGSLAGDSLGIVLPNQDFFFQKQNKTNKKLDFRLRIRILAKEKKAKFDKHLTSLQTEGFDFWPSGSCCNFPLYQQLDKFSHILILYRRRWRHKFLRPSGSVFRWITNRWQTLTPNAAGLAYKSRFV